MERNSSGKKEGKTGERTAHSESQKISGSYKREQRKNEFISPQNPKYQNPPRKGRNSTKKGGRLSGGGGDRRNKSGSDMEGMNMNAGSMIGAEARSKRGRGGCDKASIEGERVTGGLWFLTS